MRVTDVTLYDGDIEAAAREFLPQLDWQWLKAQLWQESLLDPNAKSRVGALGLGQFMPGTWAMALRAKRLRLPSDAKPTDPEHAIRAAAWYDSTLWEEWSAKRRHADRRRLMFASYNAGIGNLLQAQLRANGAREYSRIVAMLPGVTGTNNAHQTTDYVEKIERWFAELIEG